MDHNTQIAARCIFPRLNTIYYFEKEEYKRIIHKLIDFGVCGFCIFGGEKDQVKKMTSELRSYAEQPLMFAADLENGLPMRFVGGTAFPHAMALGKTKDPTKTGIVAKLIAQEAKEIGINWNLAPVCDVNSNPKNPIINIRAYSENDKEVSEHAVYYIRATQNENLLACAKHFPGHGDTELDSHLEMPVILKSKEELEELELKPFKNAIKGGVKSIMVGHLAVPNLEDEKIPASLSPVLIRDILIGELGYDGLIVSDALEMKSISENFTSAEATEKFFKAGGHIALMPENPLEALQHISELVEGDKEIKEHLENSYRKLKKEMDFSGAMNPPEIDSKYQQYADIESESQGNMNNERIALQIARDSVELKIDNIVLPIEADMQYAGFAFLQKEEDFQPASMFFNFLQQALENECDFGYINEDISDDDLEQLQIGTSDADIFIFAMYYKARSYNGSIGIAEKISPIIKKLSMGKPTVCIYFGNPYLSEEIKTDTSILTFSDSLASLAAATMIVSGRTDSAEEMQDRPND